MPKKKTGGEITRKLIAEIPESVFKALKIHAAQTDSMMKDLVADALRRYLGIAEGGEAGEKLEP